MEEQITPFDETSIQENEPSTKNVAFSETELQQMDEARMYVYGMSKWASFFIILMIISIVLLFVVGIAIIVMSPALHTINMPFRLIGVLYIANAGVYIVLVRYLKRIKKSAQLTVQMNDNNAMLDFLKYNKKVWKFIGVFTIVLIALSLIVIPIVTIAAAASAL